MFRCRKQDKDEKEFEESRFTKIPQDCYRVNPEMAKLYKQGPKLEDLMPPISPHPPKPSDLQKAISKTKANQQTKNSNEISSGQVNQIYTSPNTDDMVENPYVNNTERLELQSPSDDI